MNISLTKYYWKYVYPVANYLYKINDIIFVLLLLLFLLILILMKLKIRMGLIKKLRIEENSKLKLFPIMIIFFYFFINLILFFFYLPNSSKRFSYQIMRFYTPIEKMNIESKIIEENNKFSPTLTLDKFFETYDVILVTQIFLSFIFLYIILMKILFDIDFV